MMRSYTQSVMLLVSIACLSACAKPVPTEEVTESNVAKPEEAIVPTPERAEPQGADLATTPPTEEDLKTFTADLGQGVLHASVRTSMGSLDCVLFENETPITVANFAGLSRGLKAWTMPAADASQQPQAKVNMPLYEDVLCHRVIPGFMIQCGDPLGTGTGGPGYQIPDEFSPALKHDRPGLLSMANAGPNTGGSQFFITEVATPHLDNKHTVFGECDNVELIKEIARVERGAQDRPVQDIVIKSIDLYRAQ